MNPPKLSQTLRNSPKRSETLSNAAKYSQTIPNSPKSPSRRKFSIPKNLFLFFLSQENPTRSSENVLLSKDRIFLEIYSKFIRLDNSNKLVKKCNSKQGLSVFGIFFKFITFETPVKFITFETPVRNFRNVLLSKGEFLSKIYPNSPQSSILSEISMSF